MNTHKEVIDHKYLEPGHTYIECNEDFGVIEKHKRHIPYVFLPHECITAISESCRNFKVYEMTANDFFSFADFDGIKKKVQNIMTMNVIFDGDHLDGLESKRLSISNEM
ncbi:unnamed protein product [Psylliodes chrysocephalus]|uniref:Uncharacterized protein n=1 Tax=Psylliodes chrysocephalus TaxID=3402493 RepID=A0A9P0D4D3_9CUCU|nr:unnamed protein product [Psylliodes chrysocephala]